jgi:hypothetical protein
MKQKAITSRLKQYQAKPTLASVDITQVTSNTGLLRKISTHIDMLRSSGKLVTKLYPTAELVNDLPCRGFGLR